jgi:MFS family permease
MAIFLVGGMFGGLIFNPFERKLHEYVLCCGFLALVLGFLIIYFAQSLPVLFLGAFVVGTSIGFEMPGTLLYATNYNTVEAATAGCAVIHMAGQLGTVCSALFYTPVAGLIKPNNTAFRFVFAAVCCTVFAILTAVAVSFAKKKRTA